MRKPYVMHEAIFAARRAMTFVAKVGAEREYGVDTLPWLFLAYFHETEGKKNKAIQVMRDYMDAYYDHLRFYWTCGDPRYREARRCLIELVAGSD